MYVAYPSIWCNGQKNANIFLIYPIWSNMVKYGLYDFFLGGIPMDDHPPSIVVLRSETVSSGDVTSVKSKASQASSTIVAMWGPQDN
jgi:hypothetical protein